MTSSDANNSTQKTTHHVHTKTRRDIKRITRTLRLRDVVVRNGETWWTGLSVLVPKEYQFLVREALGYPR